MWFWRVDLHIHQEITWEDFLLKCQEMICINDTTQLVLHITAADLDGYEIAMKIIEVRGGGWEEDNLEDLLNFY